MAEDDRAARRARQGDADRRDISVVRVPGPKKAQTVLRRPTGAPDRKPGSISDSPLRSVVTISRAAGDRARAVDDEGDEASGEQKQAEEAGAEGAAFGRA